MLADTDGQLRWASASDQRAQTLEDNQELFAAGPCAEAFSTGRPAVMHDATLERRWGEITLVFVEVHIRSGLSVPVELGGGPIGTLDLYAADPRGWDDTEIMPHRPMPGSWPACSWPRPRPSSAAPWPTSSRSPSTPGA
jgi:GAF domain-containing protein